MKRYVEKPWSFKANKIRMSLTRRAAAAIGKPSELEKSEKCVNENKRNENENKWQATFFTQS